ncbi:unnamed protein product, partial [Symbiodinium microadriaticum]
GSSACKRPWAFGTLLGCRQMGSDTSCRSTSAGPASFHQRRVSSSLTCLTASLPSPRSPWRAGCRSSCSSAITRATSGARIPSAPRVTTKATASWVWARTSSSMSTPSSSRTPRQ